MGQSNPAIRFANSSFQYELHLAIATSSIAYFSSNSSSYFNVLPYFLLFSRASFMPLLFHKQFHLSKSRSFYVVHHFSFLDSFLNSEEHSLENCPLDRLLLRSDTMAEREPLLPRQNRPSHQHSIFQLVCHSPWYYIGQRSLLFARSFLALYLSAVLGLAVYYECTPGHRKHAKFFPFHGSTISFVVQVIYYWITAVCFRSKEFPTAYN